MIFKNLNKEMQLKCPICGFEQTHLLRVEEHNDCNDGRKCVRLYFYCESLCSFSINFKQHKGDTIIEVEK